MGLGIKSQGAFRLGSDNGIAAPVYPKTVAEAAAEELLLGGYDQLSFSDESVEENRAQELGESLLGVSSTEHMDLVSILPGGNLNIVSMYDGIVQILAAALGFEKPDTTESPTYENGQALTAGSLAANTWVDAAYTFVSGDVGKMIRVTSGAGIGQVRQIISVGGGNATVDSNWAITPSASDTGEMAQEFQHLLELSKELGLEKIDNEWSSYPNSTDYLIRYGTLGVYKGRSKPWIWNVAMINSITISFNTKSGMTISIDPIPFNLDRNSAINTAATTWGFNTSPLFTPVNNERILFRHLGAGAFRIGAFGAGVLDSDDDICIDGFSITLNNNLKADDQTACSGLYRSEPKRGDKREITGSFSIPRFENDKFIDWSQNNSVLKAYIKLQGSTIATSARSFELFLNSFKLEKASAPVPGSQVIKQSINFRCLVPIGLPVFNASGDPVPTFTDPYREIAIRILNQYPYNPFKHQNNEY